LAQTLSLPGEKCNLWKHSLLCLFFRISEFHSWQMPAAAIAIAMAGLFVAASKPSLWLHKRSSFDDWSPPSSPIKTVASETLSSVFKKVVLTSSTGKDDVLAMEAAMEASYTALPKNRKGFLSRNSAAYLVQKYVMQVHHFSIRGLGPDPAGAQENASSDSGNVSQTSAAEIFEALLDTRQAGRGLSLRDTATLAVMLHKLVMDHSVTLMFEACRNLAFMGMLPEDEEFTLPILVKVIWAWQWLHRHTWDTEWNLLMTHMTEPTHAMDEFGKLATNLAEAKFYQERNSQNPFKAKTLSVADVVQIVQEAAEGMGTWQNDDCKAMKNSLVHLDPERDGRVPLDLVYDQPMAEDAHGELVFRFSESQDYLRSVGALDEYTPSKPQVLISNYLLGPANCYRSTMLHTFCCLNECDAVLGEVERAVEGPSAEPHVLAPLLGNMTTTSMLEAQPLSEELAQKLSAIAVQNGGKVPLHGRLFAQWLHFAFPYECPYPHVTQKDSAGNALMTSYFEGHSNTTANWTDEEMLPLAEEEALVNVTVRGVICIAFMTLALTAACNQIRVMAVARARNLKKEVLGLDFEKCA